MRQLFDHEARVNRLSETADEYGDSPNRYVAADDLIRCAIVPPKFRASQGDAGSTITGITEAYFDADADVEMNDILDVVSGPEAPRKLRVLSVARPRGHHTEAICEPFTRTVTAAP